MPGKRLDESAGDTITTEFETTPLMSTYLIAFIVSDFKNTETISNVGNEVTPFRHRVFAKPQEVNNTEYALAEGERILNAIADYVQTEFSIPKMDQAAIPQFSAGGKAF